MNRIPALVLLSLALLASPAVAQSGPAPGYEDPLLYAQDYATGQTDEAAADPAAYATSHATPEAAAAEAEHSAYLACWTADVYAGGAVPGCESFYTPPGQGNAEAPDQEPESFMDATQDPAEEAADAIDDFGAEVVDAAQTIVDDPEQAPSQAERIVGALQTFLDRIVGAAVAVAEGVAAGVVATVQGVMDGIEGVGAGLGFAAVETGGLMADAGSAVGGGMATAADATGDGIATAADAVGDAVASVATALADTVSGWFDGGAGRSSDGGTPLPRLDGATDDVTGLVEGVLDTVEDL